MIEEIFVNVSIILVIAIAIAFLAQALRQPLIIAYIITGLVVGPLGLNMLYSGLEFYDILAEFGVILLLFLVGLSLNFSLLRTIGKASVVTGLGQVIFTVFFGYFILLALGFSQAMALCLAISITFSSTIIIMKLLSDKNEARMTYGRYTIGLMLVQDVVAIALLIMLPTFTAEQSMLLAAFSLLAKVLAFFAFIYLAAKLILPVIISRAAHNGGEFLLIFSLAWCFALAGLAEWFGLSLEIGAIMAGLSLGSSVYQLEIASRIRPIRDFFIALFFIILGAKMDVNSLDVTLLPGLVLAAFVLLGNPLILYFLYRRLRFTRRNSLLAGLTAAQVSEFGFVFLFVAESFSLVDETAMSIFTIVAVVTIFISSYLITYNHQVYRFAKPLLDIFGKDQHKNGETVDKTYDVLVMGYHRLGWKICDALRGMKIDFAVVDFDTMAIKKLKDRGIPFFFGDLNDVEFLEELPIKDARMIISTLPKADDQLMLVEYVRERNQKALILANLAHKSYLEDMYRAGADYIMMPHLTAGIWMAEILKKNKWNRRTFKKLTNMQKKELQLKFSLIDEV